LAWCDWSCQILNWGYSLFTEL